MKGRKHQYAKKGQYRQTIRRKLFDSKFQELRFTDFPGEPTRFRDLNGMPCHRPDRSVLRAMAREYAKRQWKMGRERDRKFFE